MTSKPDSGVKDPDGSGIPSSDLSILIEDLRRFAFDEDSIQESFDSVVKAFEESSDQILEIRTNTGLVIEKLHEHFSDHVLASELIEGNATLFEEIRQLLPANSEPLSSSEEEQSFENEKLLLEEVIDGYRNEISVLESQLLMQLEDMKSEHDMERHRLNERRESLESQIQTYMQDFERQKRELKIKHDRIVETLANQFRTRLFEIEEMKSHRQCESELATWRSSWNETLRGLEVAIEHSRHKASGTKTKKRRTTSRGSSRGKVPKHAESQRSIQDPVHSGGGDRPVLRECSVVINSLEEIPDSGDDSSPAKSTNEASSNVTNETEPSPQSSPSSSTENSSQRKRLYSEQPIESTLGPITETIPNTIEGYLRSLQRIVSENTKEQKRLKRKEAP